MPLEQRVKLGELIINLRAEAAPDLTVTVVRKGQAATTASFTGSYSSCPIIVALQRGKRRHRCPRRWYP